jgi:CHAD domain-containing protein
MVKLLGFAGTSPVPSHKRDIGFGLNYVSTVRAPMSYRIKKGERLAAAFGRIAAEEIDVAMSQLDRRNPGEGIHNSRKALKRLRALLRSLRVAFPGRFRAENRHIADAGRKFSPLRDVHVQLRALQELGSRGAAGRRTRRLLLHRQSEIQRSTPALRRTVKEMLRASSQNIATWPLAKAKPQDLGRSLVRVFKQGRREFKAACKRGSAECLHEWRKKAKLLGYGLELIKEIGPGKVSKLIECLDALSESLGDDHDLFMVGKALGSDKLSRQAGDYHALVRRIRARRRKLQKRSFKIGRIVYAERPGNFKKKLDYCLSALNQTG